MARTAEMPDWINGIDELEADQKDLLNRQLRLAVISKKEDLTAGKLTELAKANAWPPGMSSILTRALKPAKVLTAKLPKGTTFDLSLPAGESPELRSIDGSVTFPPPPMEKDGTPVESPRDLSDRP